MPIFLEIKDCRGNPAALSRFFKTDIAPAYEKKDGYKNSCMGFLMTSWNGISRR